MPEFIEGPFTHRVRGEDKGRIKCCHFDQCGNQADVCVHGDPVGFYYYCDNCYADSGYAPATVYSYTVTRYTLLKEVLFVKSPVEMVPASVDELVTNRNDPHATPELLYVKVQEVSGEPVVTFGEVERLPEHRRAGA